ncbi:MAG: glutamate-cysteine ligase family protein [Cyclobacteriaceae bacterium]
MANKKKLHLFQAYGIELEYMIVDKDTLDIKPIADELMKLVAGDYVEDYDNGIITWSNELALHVIELKCTEPTEDLALLSKEFAKNVQEINKHLEAFNAQLLGTGAHPWMTPAKEAKLWPHSNNTIYQKYNEMFDCKGHGWSNLQSMHINFPFYDDEEFAALHAAIRVIMPIIPALSASTPILDLKKSTALDQRLLYYESNQKKIPSITGRVIPERAFSKRQYKKLIYDPIAEAIAPFDPDHILDPVWVNSRGAIARFDRGSIEIRIIDLQECPKVDLAIAWLVISAVKLLVNERLSTTHEQQELSTNNLKKILDGVIFKTGQSMIVDQAFLQVLGITAEKISAKDIWFHLLGKITIQPKSNAHEWQEVIEKLLTHGSLSNRILQVLGSDFDKQKALDLYQDFAQCLSNDSPYFK